MTDTTTIVIKVPAEDYHDRTGDYAVATALIADHGGQKTGGGTCFITSVSDVDVEVPRASVAGLTAALDAAGLSWLQFDDNDE